MVGLISVISRQAVSGVPPGFDQLQRLEQAAGFSMVAFETEDDLDEQPMGYAGLWEGENSSSSDARGVTHRVAALIDDCAAVVTSYLRPAF
jgi:hypothetical protein